MTIQPEWSGAVQRELDVLQRNLDKLLTITEYQADKRANDIRFDNINEKIHDNESEIQTLHTEVREGFINLRHEITTALNRETEDRKAAIKEYIDSKKSQFRWLVSMVMIPLGIALVDLLFKKN